MTTIAKNPYPQGSPRSLAWQQGYGEWKQPAAKMLAVLDAVTAYHPSLGWERWNEILNQANELMSILWGERTAGRQG